MIKCLLTCLLCVLFIGEIIINIQNRKLMLNTETIVNQASNTYNDETLEHRADKTSIKNLKENFDKSYISDANYKDDMKNVVVPFISTKRNTGYIDGKDNIKIYYQKYNIENAKGSIVISHEFTESLEKYHEVIYYFLKNGFNVYGIEHRGHGRSSRLGIEDKTQIHVKCFDDYIDDMKTFVDEIVIPDINNQPLYLYCHSMGGGIGARFLELYNGYFNKAILSSPMFDVNTGKFPKLIANIIVKGAVLIGLGGKYVIGKTPYDNKEDFEEANTSSYNRYKYYYDILSDNEELQRGGASYNWTNESFKVDKEIISNKNTSKIKTSILLFQAENDQTVNADGQNKFVTNTMNCTLEKVENSKHEIYAESDEIQKRYFKKIIIYLNT